jgi:hypothetical protein
MNRLLRLALAVSCPLLALAFWWDLSGPWKIPLLALCCVNAVLSMIERKSTHPDDPVVLNLHR